MEKINIARRYLEKHEPIFLINNNKIKFPLKMNEFFYADTSTPLNLLNSLVTIKAGRIQVEKRQFAVEVVSGLDKPIKLLLSIEPIDYKPHDNIFFTTREAARILKVSRKTIYRQLKLGNLQGIKIGCQWRVIIDSKSILKDYERRND